MGLLTGGQRGEKIFKAKALLGVGPDAEPADIRAAFAARAKESHPDSGGSGGDIQELKAARNLLLMDARGQQRLPSDNDAAMQYCQMCGGSGRVAVGFANEGCTSCNGTGEVRC